jgi:hypothetical protein
MMDAGTRAGKLCLVHLFIVIDHERDIQVAVRHVAGDMTARVAGAGLTKAEYVLIEFGGALEIFDLDSNVNDASHCLLSLSECANGRNLFGAAVIRKHRLLRAVNVKESAKSS